MAKCNFCGKDMLKANGCKPVPFPVKHKGMVAPARVGDGDDVLPGNRCGDCGAKYGFYHHPGCDTERCPVCGQQALTCDCSYSVEIPDTSQAVEHEICCIEAVLENCAGEHTKGEIRRMERDKDEYEELLHDEAFFKDGVRIAEKP